MVSEQTKGNMTETTEKLGSPREFDAAIAQAVGGPVTLAREPQRGPGIQILSRPPTFTINVPDSTGKARYFDIADKKAFWSVPDDQLKHRAAQICVRPGRKLNAWRPKKEGDEAPAHEGKVLVVDADGKQLARYPNPNVARASLGAAGVRFEELPGGDKLAVAPKKKAA